jgi:hypothetical protein
MLWPAYEASADPQLCCAIYWVRRLPLGSTLEIIGWQGLVGALYQRSGTG